MPLKSLYIFNILYHILCRVNGIHYLCVYVLYDLIPTGRFTQELEGGIISRDSWFIPIMIKMYEGQIHVSSKMKLKFRKIHYIKSEDLFTPWLKQKL